MTLTAEQVLQYEARAAAGEKPVLPWIVNWIDDSSEVTMSSHPHESPTEVELTLWVEKGIVAKSVSFKAYYLAADDALAAFAAPLHEREVAGPWRVEDDTLFFHSGDLGRTSPSYIGNAAEALAIANVRNAHHARRQAKEAGK